jgi:FtsP/CotA-like multicopper oxidase with cupredoxin domain
MRTRMTKLIGLGFLLVVLAVLLVGAPVQAEPQPPATNELANAPAASQPPAPEGLNPSAAPVAASHTFDLCATDGTVTLPDGTTVGIWGFVDTGGGSCVSGSATLPGPELWVAAGDSVTINLTNSLPEPVSTSLLVPGQLVAAGTGTTPPDASMFTAEVSPGGTGTYEIASALEGTYLYESGTDPTRQVALGLYGALIVESGTSGVAYGESFDVEAVLALGEIDPDLNADPLGFDMLNYDPIYWLINGRAFPQTDSIEATAAEDEVLLRYLNAGFHHPSMAVLGAHQRVIARDAFALTNSFEAVAETIPSGQTVDAIVTVPTGAGVGDSFPLYNRNMYVTNGPSYPGGMLTALEIPAPPDQLYFSTTTNFEVPTTSGPWDDADIYSWNGSGFSRVFNARVSGGGASNLPVNADVNALKVVDNNTFYMSFARNGGTSVPAPVGTADDEDVVLYDGGNWSLYFDGGLAGLDFGNGGDVDAFEILDGTTVLVSTTGNPTAVVAKARDEDLLRCDHSGAIPITSCTWSLYFDGDDVSLGNGGGEDVNGAAVDGSDFYLTTVGDFDVGSLSGQRADVFSCDSATTGKNTTTCASFTLFFDGDVLLGANERLDAIDVP